MTVFRVAYNPGLSDAVKSELSGFNPVMVNPNDYGAQFSIGDVVAAVNVVGTENDDNILKELASEKIDYVEVT